ncbi:DUF2059 domain-containing protein [Mucilaginibacter antarcticus]|uniref:DUF2059 domain-containing protein n=1 Tax=Mucilaginibacter antarcticus TaxID=1855725 RepID=A0ABW5XMA2_9SPHI
MKKTLLIVLLAGLGLNASAQTSHANTLKLFKLMGTEKNANAMADNMKAMFSQTMAKADPKRAQEMSAIMASEIKTLAPKLIADMVPIYEKHFTARELQKYIDFYSTPEGQKMVNLGPVLQKEMMSSMMTKYIPEMQKRMAAKMLETKKK